MPPGMQDTTNVVVAVYDVRVLVLVVVSQYSRNFPSLETLTIEHDHSPFSKTKQNLPLRRSWPIHTGDNVIVLNVSRSLMSLNVVSNSKNFVHNRPLLLTGASSAGSSIIDAGVAQGGGGKS